MNKTSFNQMGSSSEKEGIANVPVNTKKPQKRIISSKNKVGLGKLCSLFSENEAESDEPVWKCVPSQSQSQSNSSLGKPNR